jgi:DNA-binding HxlR family transcriptional regulator
MSEHEQLIAESNATPQHVSPALCAEYHRAVELIGRRWMGAILYLLLQRPLRFNELLAAIPGISDRLLTERLRELEAEGLAVRHVIASSPVRVEYELTEAGRDLHGVTDAIGQWAHKWLQPE